MVIGCAILLCGGWQVASAKYGKPVVVAYAKCLNQMKKCKDTATRH
jgi:hypothetical protein